MKKKNYDAVVKLHNYLTSLMDANVPTTARIGYTPERLATKEDITVGDLIELCNALFLREDL